MLISNYWMIGKRMLIGSTVVLDGRNLGKSLFLGDDWMVYKDLCVRLD